MRRCTMRSHNICHYCACTAIRCHVMSNVAKSHKATSQSSTLSHWIAKCHKARMHVHAAVILIPLPNYTHTSDNGLPGVHDVLPRVPQLTMYPQFCTHSPECSIRKASKYGRATTYPPARLVEIVITLLIIINAVMLVFMTRSDGDTSSLM